MYSPAATSEVRLVLAGRAHMGMAEFIEIKSQARLAVKSAAPVGGAGVIAGLEGG
jgi:hypothetical protein